MRLNCWKMTLPFNNWQFTNITYTWYMASILPCFIIVRLSFVFFLTLLIDSLSTLYMIYVSICSVVFLPQSRLWFSVLLFFYYHTRRKLTRENYWSRTSYWLKVKCDGITLYRAHLATSGNHCFLFFFWSLCCLSSFFWSLYCLSFFLLVIILPVLFRFTVSIYPFGIFKVFLGLSSTYKIYAFHLLLFELQICTCVDI
jgi:hypothetical protein